MSLNLVSEQLLSANGLNHQDLFAILGQLTERRLDVKSEIQLHSKESSYA